MTQPTFIERPRRGLARLLHVAAIAVFSVAGGTGVGFLALAFAGVAGVELAPRVWGNGDIDAMLRAGVGAAGLALGLALGAGAVLLAVARLAHARQLARDAVAEPDVIASWETRKVIALDAPFGGLTVFACIFLPIDALAVLVVSLALGKGADDNWIGFVVLWVLVGLAAVVIVLLVVSARVWKQAWAVATSTVRRSWNADAQRAARQADAAAELNGPRSPVPPGAAAVRGFAAATGRIASIAGAIGGIAFFIGLFTRQPCRNCDEVYYPDAGERALDALMAVAAIVTAVALAVLVLSLVAGWLAAIIDDRMLVRLAREGANRPGGGVLVARLTTTDPGTLAGAALAGLGGGLLPIIAVADSVAPGFWPVCVIPTLVVVALAGVVTIGVAEGATARMRNTWRAAWHPGDVVAPEPPRRKPRPEVGE